MAMFAIEEPNRSPSARSGAPALAAVTSVTSSGSEVANANSSVPTNSRLIFVRSAIWSAYPASEDPARTNTAALTTNTTTASHKLIPPLYHEGDTLRGRNPPELHILSGKDRSDP